MSEPLTVQDSLDLLVVEASNGARGEPPAKRQAVARVMSTVSLGLARSRVLRSPALPAESQAI
eukprot:CAMPEP_0204378560 /NCGR_PEP_ID=MMETSP0469-20131031/51877_1 /ASSEMBLY_ACC=CAM_ASM_000384 /TAXON_ID=2969 /ORGANISM="Oxyrrhis marina" /LENGTH=62 /DNA_ID=CAMNT_0051369863 /DNA_START=18 /DNA_END=206 /DNA_ORIENTATION=-